MVDGMPEHPAGPLPGPPPASPPPPPCPGGTLVLDEQASAMSMGISAIVCLRISSSLCSVCMRIEHGHPRDPIDGQPAALRRAPNRFRARRLVDAEALLLVVAHVRAQPRHAGVGVALDHRCARERTAAVHRETPGLGEASFDDVARHRGPRSRTLAIRTPRPHRWDYLFWALRLPIFREDPEL